MEQLFNPLILNNLRDELNSSPIFTSNIILSKKQFNLICAVLDRVGDSIDFINNHYTGATKDINNFYLYMVYGDMLKDSIEYLLNNFEIKIDKSFEIFKQEQQSMKLINEKDFIDDNKFYKFIRSLIFAHPCRTSYYYQKPIGEVYCPYINTLYNFKNSESVSLRIYCTQEEKEDFIIDLSINHIFTFLNSYYLLLVELTKKLNKIKMNQLNVWRLNKINRQVDDLSILKQIRNKLSERYEDTFDINEIINIYELNVENEINRSALLRFQCKISKVILQLCELIDSCEHNKLIEVLAQFNNVNIDMGHQNFYHYSKVCEYMDKEDINIYDYRFSMDVAKEFYENFAKNYVYIDFDRYSSKEIKYLIKLSNFVSKI